MEILDDTEAQSTAKDLNNLILNGYDFQIGEYINRGFAIFKENVGPFVGYTFLFSIINIFLVYTLIGQFFVQGPLTIGFSIAAYRLSRKKSFDFGDFFKGFDFFVPLLLATLVMSVFITIGFIFLIIPGIYLAVAYSATAHLIVFRKMDFWEAMEASRKLVSKEWFSIFGFMIVLGLINLCGFLCLGVGLLFTVPITSCAVYAAYADIVGVDADHP